MVGKLLIAGAGGRLGFATLNALLDHNLIPASDIVCTTSSEPGAQKLQHASNKGVDIRTANWDDQASWEAALQEVDKFFLISSARVEKDFNDAPPGEGREADHFRALEAAKKVGVKHVYYTSLAFANPSFSRVMKAHERTEQWLEKSNLTYTIIREGLYNESWPLYLGHYDLPGGDDRTEVPIAGDSKISWTSIPDLGLASALILSAPAGDWAGKTCYLAQSKSHTIQEVALMISKARGREMKLKIVSRPEHEQYYVAHRGMDEFFVKWWSKTYDALKQNECKIDDPTLESLLATKGVQPKPMEETVNEMLKDQKGFTGR